jgi:anaerobic selenocysteine-containing dehydrogenase
MINPFKNIKEKVETSPIISDEVKQTTCYMCACRCGINVHFKDGDIRYIEGNKNHPTNKGVLCAKGSAGIMQQNSPAKLTKPLMRTGERGSGEFKEIEWDEAFEIATTWLSDIRNSDPKKLAFFTGRDQSQSFTGWWAKQFGTPNFAAHGGFCSVNMAAAGLYTIGGSFWEFGEIDWENTKYLMLFGCAEDHDSNPIKMGLGKLKTRKNTKFISVNPVKTGYSAIADEWIGIKPGTDGLFIHSIIYELLKANKIDWDYLARYTNAPWLIYNKPGDKNDGLFVRNEKGQPLVYDNKSKNIVPFSEASSSLSFLGEYDYNGEQIIPSFAVLAKEYLKKEYRPENIASQIEIDSKTIKKIASELAEVAFEKEITLPIKWTDWKGVEHDEMIGRPVSMHAMRGISAHSNGFNTCKLIHILQIFLGSIDTPGGFRYKPPFPKHVVPGPKPTGKDSKPNTPLSGMPLGFPSSPEDLLVDKEGNPLRIDKAYSWEHPLSAHGLMHMVINNAWEGSPYKIDVLFMYMANMAWNSSMNTSETIKKLTDKDPETGEYKIPKIIYSDAYYSETVPYADLILPDTTYLERWDCISLLDRPISSAEGAADAIRQPVLKLNRDVKPFQDVLLKLGERLGLPGFVNDDKSAKYPGGYSDYIVNHERQPGVGPLAGWRGEGNDFGKGDVNPNQLNKYIENGCFHFHELKKNQQYYKFANKSYLEFSKNNGWIGSSDPIIFQLYSEEMQKFKLAGMGFGDVVPPSHLRGRITKFFNPIPIWYKPFEEEHLGNSRFNLHAITQRPPHMYHSWGSQNAWLRQITSHNYLYISEELADENMIKDNDWVWLESSHKKIKVPCRTMKGVNKSTVWTWNAIGKRKGSWNLSPDAPESNKGFLLNHLISDLLPEQKDGYRYSNSDPITGQASWYDLKVKLIKCTLQESLKKEIEPNFPIIKNKSRKNVDLLKYGNQFKKIYGKKNTELHYEFIGNKESYEEKK